MDTPLKILLSILLLGIFMVNPSLAQSHKMKRLERKKIDSIRDEQLRSWYLEKQNQKAMLKEGQADREAFLNSPRGREYLARQRLEDSLRHAGYVETLDTITETRNKLKLFNGDFDRVPEKIFALKYLDTLDLFGNNLESFDGRSFSRDNLKYLNIAGNRLNRGSVRFSRDVSRSLEYLDVSENALKRTPGCLRNMKGLRELKMSDNADPDKPFKAKIYKWDSLKVLDLSHNNLKKIPGKVRKLAHLEILNLSYNNIKTLKGLHRLDNIRELEISFNPLFLDPELIVSLPKLEKLIIRHCGLTYLPPEIKRLSNLKKLVVPENRLEEIPPELGELKKLENLMLYKNNLHDLPVELFSLSNLIWLDVYYNDLKYISPDIVKLQNLEILYLSYNKLRELPESLGQMARLRELYLHHNQLRELPASLGNLKDLKYLHVYENHLTVFPEQVLQLENLEELNLSANLISEFPKEIAQYENLKYIYLDQNNTDKRSLSYEYFKWALKQLQDKGVLIRFDY